MLRMEAEASTHPRVTEFERQCGDAGIAPEAVLKEAGLHRSAWFRWKAGTFEPRLRSWDAVQEAFTRLRQGGAA